MNQFIPTYRGQAKHTKPSTNSYAAAYGYGFDSRELLPYEKIGIAELSFRASAGVKVNVQYQIKEGLSLGMLFIINKE